MKGVCSILIVLAAVAFTSCRKKQCDGSPSHCIQKKVKEFKQDQSCHDAGVTEYEFQDEKVYVFSPGTCGADMSSMVMDCDCNELGYLGGITGNNTINGESFSNAVFVKNL